MAVFIHRAIGTSPAWRGRAFLAVSSLMAAAVVLLALLRPAEAAFRKLPEGRIAIDLGDAFTPSDSFTGFVDASTRASFAVIELPASAYDRLKTIPDSPEALANEGFGGTAKAELKGRQGAHVYLVGKQQTPAGEVTKFVLIFQQEDLTGVIVANVPQAAIDAGRYSREGVEAVLATAGLREDPAVRKELVRFNYLGPFKEAFDHGGMTKAYNVSGAQPHSGGNRLVQEAMLLVSMSIHGDAIDAKAQSHKAFMELGGMKERHVHESKEIAIADLKGYQITGEVTDAESGNRIAIHLVTLAGEPFGYFMFLGSAPMADKERMMPEIEKVIASFELVK